MQLIDGIVCWVEIQNVYLAQELMNMVLKYNKLLTIKAVHQWNYVIIYRTNSGYVHAHTQTYIYICVCVCVCVYVVVYSDKQMDG